MTARFSPGDEAFMAMAIELGLSGQGQTGANPSVGCLIVNQGMIVGRGVTAPGGHPHAGPQALANAGHMARGATVYVSLEPCSHHGDTPPCAAALIRAGVARVVAATRDPNPLLAGRGLAVLKAAGIEVACGLLEAEARRSVAGHISRVTRGRPEIFLKMAVSAEGTIGRLGEGQIAISGPESRIYAHRLRAGCDCIAVGIGTAIGDDPELNCRIEGLEHRSPVRLVIDRQARLPLTSRLVRTARDLKVMVAVAQEADAARVRALQEHGVEVIVSPLGPDGQIDLAALSRQVCDLGYNRLMVEGGARLARALLLADLIDEVHLVESDRSIGEPGVPALGDLPLERLKSDPFAIVEQGKLGADRLTIAWKKEWL